MATQPTVDDLVRRVADALRGEFRSRLRAELLRQPPEWLADELLARVPDPYAPTAHGTSVPQPRTAPEPSPAEADGDRSRRLDRIRAWELDHDNLEERVSHLNAWNRERLESEGLLLGPPPKGGPLISPAHRSPAGEDLLRDAKDLLYALLFGEEDEGVRLHRVERELLTLTLPRDKAHTVAFMLRAATEIGAVGTWQDPVGRADDERAPNMLFQVEYGEVADELVGHGIAAALRVVNDLEVNEQVLYGRMENVEESTLA